MGIIFFTANSNGFTSVSCEPMCICTPRNRKILQLRRRAYAFDLLEHDAELVSCVPVVIFACVLASTFGFTRTEMGAIFFSRAATLLMRCNSGSLSALNVKTPLRNANSISASVLPTPAKTHFRASPPAAMTRCNSPPLTMSKPPPRLAIVRGRIGWNGLHREAHG